MSLCFLYNDKMKEEKSNRKANQAPPNYENIIYFLFLHACYWEVTVKCCIRMEHSLQWNWDRLPLTIFEI